MLEEYGYITDVDTNEILYINETLLKCINITDSTNLKHSQVIEKFDMVCDLDEIKDLDVINKGHHYHKKTNKHYITKQKFTKYNNKTLFIHTFYDITEEIAEIAQLEDKILTNKAIIKCANTLLKDTGTSTNIKKLLEIICKFYQGERVNIFLFTRDRKFIKGMHDYYTEGSFSILDIIKDKDILADNWIDITKDNNYYCESLEKSFDKNLIETSLLKEFGIESIMVSAIQKDNENVGFIVIDNPKNKPTDFDLLDTASIFVASNIERQFFESELETSVLDTASKIDISDFILECADILFKNKDITLAINQLLEVISNYFQADRCSVLEYKALGDDEVEHADYVHLKMNYEYSRPGVGSVLNTIKGQDLHQDLEVYNRLKIYNCVHTKLEDLNITQNALEHQILLKNDVKSVMIVPLRKGDEVTGLLVLQNPSVKLTDTNVLYTISGFLISELNKRDIVKELEELSFTDKLTGLYNRNYYLKTIEILQLSPPDKLGVIFADINGLKRVNDNLGHEYGDAFIKWCSNFLNQHNDNYPVFRIGGDEFICIVYNMEVDEFFDHIKSMRDALYEANLVNMSMGGTFVDGNVDINKQIVETDKIMYHEKQKYYILKKLMNVNVESELVTLKNLLKEHLLQ